MNVKFEHRKCVLINVNSKKQIITLKEMEKYLGENLETYTLSHLDEKGYRLGLFLKDGRINKHKINKIATILAKIPIFGNCVLIDDHINLNSSKFNKIIDLSLKYKLYNDGTIRKI